MLRYFENKKQAAEYVKYRPSLTSEVTDCVMSFYRNQQTDGNSSKPSLMVDVGCGSGQATNAFHSCFNKIVGIDVSEQQLDQAKTQNVYENVEYLEGSAEEMPVSTGSVDLIVSTAASHWFDLPKFFKETERVLKPSGCLALIGYYIPAMRLLAQKNDDILAQKAAKLCEELSMRCAKDDDELLFRRSLARRRYRDIFEMIPFKTKVRNDSIHLYCLSSLQGICGLLSSFSFYQAFMEKQSSKLNENSPDFSETEPEEDPLFRLFNDLMELWNLDQDSANDLNIELDYEMFILLARKQ